MPAFKPVGIRLAARLKQEGECIVWTGAKRPGGYGVIGGSRNGEAWYDSPHRVAYALARGPIHPGHHVDHLCRNRACVNPDHLEPVTRAENNRRANSLRWHGIAERVPPSTTTVRDLIALLTGARP